MRLSQHPGVGVGRRNVGCTLEVDVNNRTGLVPEGKAFTTANDFVLGRLGLISEDYFRGFRIPLVQGRLFTADDRRGNERADDSRAPRRPASCFPTGTQWGSASPAVNRDRTAALF